MKWSESHLYTLKEKPADAEITSHALMVRAGLIRKLAPGIYTYGPLALKAIRKVEKVIREELDRRGCQELLMPMVQPRELWEETNRWTEMGDGLLKFENRNGHSFCLGATHEEAITDFVRKDLKSYRNLPVNLYQIQTKYRDEIRPRFGLMRGREFIMKDAYSFDLDLEGAQESYKKMYEAYQAIFTRLGLNFVIVQADSGNIGGNQSNEFQVLAESGEDGLMVCEEANYAANVEIAPRKVKPKQGDQNLQEVEEFATPGLRTITDLAKSTGLAENDLVKTMFFDASDGGDKIKPVAVLLCGDDEVNAIKLKNVLNLTNPPELLNDKEVKELTGASPGSCGPVDLKIPVYSDQALEGHTNFIVGANKDDFHLKNVNFERDFKSEGFFDLCLAKEGDECPEGRGGKYKAYRGIEVGHVFYLGTKYSEKMGATYLNKEGKAKPVEMGCYGIGVTRTVQAAIEQSHDQNGIVWPLPVAPYQVHICLLDPKDEKVSGVAHDFYNKLQENGVEVLMDDRDERPGVKFKDADLLGMPLRFTVGGRGVENGELEWVERRLSGDKSAKKTVAIDEAFDLVMSWLKENQK